MGAKKKGTSSRSEDSEELGHVPLQAVLLADSFTNKFDPITLERPKVLFPLVNVPMICYTLAWLKSAGVKEVFVLCCSHSKQVISYLENHPEVSQPSSFTVTTIESRSCASAGDALRLIYERDVIHGDFVLISGDTVTDMSLTQVLQDHKERRKKDKNAVMTIVVKPSQIMTHQSRLLSNGELFMAIDPCTQQLLCYEDKADHAKESIFCLDKTMLAGKSAISLHYDREDCYIDVCSPEVLSLLADNFDYQDLRRDLLGGLLEDDVMGYKIFTHEIDSSSYAAKVDNFRSYDTISKDIIQRGTYPSSTPAVQVKEIGRGTKIGDSTEILSSVIGRGCSVGSNVSIEGCYIWDNVTIEDGCKLKDVVVCDGVVIKSGAVLEPGVVLSFQVVLGEQCTVPSYLKVSLLQQPTEQDSDDEELEYVADNSNVEISPPIDCDVNKPNELGTNGAGCVWSVCDEDWRNSIAPIPAEKLAEAIRAAEEEDQEYFAQDGSSLAELELESSDSEDNCNEDDSDFENEVEATFLTAVHENKTLDHVVLEVNALRLSFNKQTAECAGAIFYSVMKLASEAPHESASELVRAAAKVISEWKHLLKYYLSDIDEEIEVIIKFEEMCLESSKEFASVFDKILDQLYDQEVIQEEAILRWVEEKTNADESDKVFVRQAENFVRWLREAEEEEW
ncbi:hypothetical protein ACLB2K_039586 [Fragaria x ananassa]